MSIDTAKLRKQCEPYGGLDDDPDAVKVILELCDELDRVRYDLAHFRQSIERILNGTYGR